MTPGVSVAVDSVVRSWMVGVLGSDSRLQGYFGSSGSFRFFGFRPVVGVARPYGWISEHRVSDSSADGVRGLEHLIDVQIAGPSHPSGLAQSAAESLVLVLEDQELPMVVSPQVRLILLRLVFLRSFGPQESGEFGAQVRLRLLTQG